MRSTDIDDAVRDLKVRDVQRLKAQDLAEDGIVAACAATALGEVSSRLREVVERLGVGGRQTKDGVRFGPMRTSPLPSFTVMSRLGSKLR